MKKLILLIIIVFFVSCTYTITYIYFDEDWKETTKENAAYYREQPKEEKGLWIINDYYITGEKQFRGYAKDSLGTILEGIETWYFKTGKVENKASYINGKQIGYYTVLEGAIGSEEEGWDEKDLVYIDDSNVAPAADAQSASTSVSEYYYTNSSQIAIQHIFNTGYDDRFSFTLYFNRQGDTIARLDKNKTSDTWKGKVISFYEKELRGKNEMTSIKEIITYNQGVKTDIEYYDTEQNLVTKGNLKDDKPYNGTFSKDVCRFTKIQTYKNGNLLTETTFNKNDEPISDINFKNDVPHTGVFYNCISLQTYKDGKLDGKSIQYLNETNNDIAFEYNYSNGLRHGDYLIYQDDSYLLEKGRYKEGIQAGEVLYYNNGGESGEDYYYLKAKVKSRNNKPYITELSQFNLDDNELIATFDFEFSTTDRFTYINNGYHRIYAKDLNSDGFNDLQIKYYHFGHDTAAYTYYLFNKETKKYEHLALLDDIDTIEIDPDEKTIKASLAGDFDEDISYITYEFSGNKLIKKQEIEYLYHHGMDTTIVRQLFPAELYKYPLLASNLPPITFIQNNEAQHITTLYQEIELKKESFSIQFPGLIGNDSRFSFNAKITASYNKKIFKEVTVNQKEEQISIFSINNTFARRSNEFIIDGSGNNVLYYNNTVDDTLNYLKNINENVLLLQFAVEKILEETKEKIIAEIDKPIYIVIYMDKNQNLKIDKNEIYYISLKLK